MPIAAAAAGGAVLLGAYAHWVEPRWLRAVVRKVPLSGLRGRPVRLLHISDLHCSPRTPLRFIRRAIDLGLALNPDIACLTGDLITAGAPYDGAGYRRVLSRLAEAVPTFGIAGNHDGGAWAIRRGGLAASSPVRNLMTEAGIEVLHNRWRTASVGDAEILLIGLGDPWAEEMDVLQAFEGLPEREPAVLLAHNPDSTVGVRDRPWNLMLSGHTHGGQIGLFGIGARLAPVSDRRFIAGLTEWEGRSIHVTAGIGSFFNLRLFCRPEVSLLILEPPRPGGPAAK